MKILYFTFNQVFAIIIFLFKKSYLEVFSKKHAENGIFI